MPTFNPAMKTRILHWLIALASLVAAAPGRAEDIDIFLARSASTAVPPSVLIILDNTANWNTPFTNEIAALRGAVSNITPGAVNLGLMMFTETGGGNSNTDGGYVRAAIRPLTATYRTQFVNLVNSLDVGVDKSNGGKAALAMMEAYRYFSGGAPIGGSGKNKTDYTGNTSYATGTPSRVIWDLSGNALPSKSATTYQPPSGISTCGKTYIIYISNGAAQDNASDISKVNAALTAAGGSTTQIPLSPSGSQDNPADEVARFMALSSFNTTVYTVDVNKVTTGQGPGWTALLKSMANVSRGRYFDVTATGSQIADALNDIFTEIQSVNTSFASVSLPVSVNTQGTYLNQVFIGQFRPDPNGFTRWVGNLKQYKIGTSGSNLTLLDADNNAAINSQTGFIAACARSYWTPSSVDSYWSFQPENNCTTVASSSASNYPDGPVVEKGAQAYRLRQLAGQVNRTVYTCAPGTSSCTTITNFNTSNAAITSTLLNTSSADRSDLINWARGADVLDEDGDTNTSEIRPSVHGDVVHSRPVAVNFGGDTAASRQVVVFYGANDGFLRAVNGNRDGELSIGGVAPGGELWSFAPPEFYSRFKDLRDNTSQINFLGATGTGIVSKPYGIDGSLTYVKSGSSTWLYAVMRRGGRAIYAFDVSTPQTPSLKWKIGCDASGCGTAGTAAWSAADLTQLASLGQTWSSAMPLRASGYGSGSSPMLIMGGGYDTCEDTDTNSTAVCASPLGNRIYVLDANTGALLKTFTTDRGVVADVTVVNDFSTVSTGVAKYAYAVDLGGNVYRIDILASAPSAWTMTKVASLGCSTTANCAPRRKFMFAPDVVDENGTYYVLMGSGDREKPLTTATQAAYPNARTVANHFFAIKDNLGSLASESTNCGGNSVICLNSLQAITTSATPTTAELGSKKGWYLALGAEEQTVTSAITLFGATTFSTTQPYASSATACTTLGTAKVYYLSYLNASSMNGTSSRSETLPAGGLPPSPVAGKVTLDTGETVPFVIGSRGTSPLDAAKPPQVNTTGTTQPTKRVYRYIQK